MVTVDTLAGIAIALVVVFVIMAVVTFIQRRAAKRREEALTAAQCNHDWKLSKADELAAKCWGLTHPEWRALDPQERADFRARILRAPGWRRG